MSGLTKEWLTEHYGVTEEQIARRKDFLAELGPLMRKHNVSISHEDGHGAFVLEDFDDHNLGWLSYAHGGLYVGSDTPVEPCEPIVCPGCYSVDEEPCAPGCVDAELARKREEPDGYDDERVDDDEEISEDQFLARYGVDGSDE